MRKLLSPISKVRREISQYGFDCIKPLFHRFELDISNIEITANLSLRKETYRDCRLLSFLLFLSISVYKIVIINFVFRYTRAIINLRGAILSWNKRCSILTKVLSHLSILYYSYLVLLQGDATPLTLDLECGQLERPVFQSFS